LPRRACGRWDIFRLVLCHGFQNIIVLFVGEYRCAAALFVVNPSQLARRAVLNPTLRFAEVEERPNHTPALCSGVIGELPRGSPRGQVRRGEVRNVDGPLGRRNLFEPIEEVAVLFESIRFRVHMTKKRTRHRNCSVVT